MTELAAGIHRLTNGISNFYLIEESGKLVLVDAGAPRDWDLLGQVVRQLRFYSEGRCLASLEFGRCGSRFGILLDLPQDQTERLLRARVTELGGVIEDGAELTGLTVGRDAVTAGVRGHGGRRWPTVDGNGSWPARWDRTR